MAEPTDDGATPLKTTDGEAYAKRLDTLQNKRWKKLLNVQAPYQANLRRMHLGRTLDVGCGRGRNLATLGNGSVGVDHNPHLIAACREQGLEAYTVDEFFATPRPFQPGAFESMLAAHLIEHLTREQAREVIGMYLPFIKPGGKVVFITPQERGHASDSTHLDFTDQEALGALAHDLGLVTEKQASFPFPRSFGKIFIYNEFNHIARLPAPAV